MHETREEYEGSALDKSTGLAKFQLNEIVGALLWLSVMTRPDISYAVATVAQYVSRPEAKIYSMASRILRYLAGTKDVGIAFAIGSVKNLHGFADSDWAADKTTRKGQSGCVLNKRTCGLVFQEAIISIIIFIRSRSDGLLSCHTTGNVVPIHSR